MKRFISSIAMLAVAVSFASCDKDTPQEPEDQPAQSFTPYSLPTVDELSVTTDVETFVYGTPGGAGTFSASLFNRLSNKVAAFNRQTTKAMIIFDNAVGSLTRDDYVNIFICHRNGGSIVIVNPQSGTFGPVIRENLMDAALYQLIDRFNMEGVDREQVKQNLQETLFNVRQAAEGHEGEMFECLGFYPGNTYSCELLPKEDITPYQCGLSADACARWMNETQKSGTKSFTSSLTKGATGEMSDYTEAEIHTETYNVRFTRSFPTEQLDYYGKPYLEDKEVEYPGIVENMLKIYIAYSDEQEADYYQVDQQITFYNGRIAPVQDITDDLSWWPKNEGVELVGIIGMSGVHFPDGQNYQVAYPIIYPLKEFHSKMYLSGKGTVQIMSSHPSTENGSTSHSASTSHGYSNSINGGVSLGRTGLLSGKFSASLSLGLTHSETYSSTTGTSRSINDLSVIKNTETNGEVSWDYIGAKPTTEIKWLDKHEYEIHWWAAPLLLSDCPQQNSILFRVTDPEGQATIHSDNRWSYLAYWYEIIGHPDDNEDHLDIACEQSSENAYTLGHPGRYHEDWTFSCVEYGDLVGRPLMINAFETRYMSDIFNGLGKTNPVGAKDSSDMTPINSLMCQFIEEFDQLSESYKAMGYTGKFTFKMRGNTSGREVRVSYTI